MKQSKSEFWSGEEYDAQYGKAYSNEISFLHDLLATYQASSLLDVCCGTGLVTIPLSNNLSRAVGIDFSSPMVEFAIEKSAAVDNISFCEMDAVDFNLGTQFDVVSMTGNAFQAFISNADFLSMLNRVKNHMGDNGVFVFDARLPCPENLEVTSGYQYWSSYISPTGEKVNVYGWDSAHPQSNDTMVHHVRRDYENGDQYHSKIELKYRSIDEIVSCLESVGLQLVRCYADWKKTPFTKASKRIVGVVSAL
ncbi:class I SAM-dependent DNA methyltransferase [Vibrio hyugaensis]|uniref:class I SAM-dependent DNA methyltransferase n=1 Tax=Vibrio hyugaensis TaxID=1534743 RepID=UPI0015E49601|nr:class I SAM-dependent methyltransferase [Vibrio hyugaensis]